MDWITKKRVKNAEHPKGVWGAITLNSMNESHSELCDMGLEKLAIPCDAICLDIGCGGGRTVSRLLDYAPQGKIYGIDISETSVRCAKLYNRKAISEDKVKIKLGTASVIPFPDNKFDIVTAVETFYFWKNKQKEVESVYAVLKPGGTFMIMLDSYEDGTDRMKEVQAEIEMELNTPEEIKSLFENAGFVDIKADIEGERLYVYGKKQ